MLKNRKVLGLVDITNKNLINTLQKSVKAENKLISDLVVKEKHLHKLIDSENKKIKRDRLEKKNKTIGFAIRKYKNEINGLQRNLKHKHVLFKQMKDLIALLERDIKVKCNEELQIDNNLKHQFDTIVNKSKNISCAKSQKTRFDGIKSFIKNLSFKKKILKDVQSLEEKREIGLIRKKSLAGSSSELNKKMLVLQKSLVKYQTMQTNIQKSFDKRSLHIQELSKIVSSKIEKMNEKEQILNELNQLQKLMKKNFVAIKHEKLNSMVSDHVDSGAMINNKDMKLFLDKVDDYLGKLPKKEIQKFAKSKDYALYKKVLNKYKVK